MGSENTTFFVWGASPSKDSTPAEGKRHTSRYGLVIPIHNSQYFYSVTDKAIVRLQPWTRSVHGQQLIGVRSQGGVNN